MNMPQESSAITASLTSAPPRDHSREQEWTAGTLLTVFRRRRSVLLTSTAGLLALATLYCCLATSRYKATGEIQVQKESSGSFGLDSSVMGRDDNTVSTDSLDYNITLQTEAQVLESQALALIVIRDLNLEKTPDYFAPHHGFPIKRWLFFWRKPIEPLSVPLSQAPNRRYVALKIFASHLKVEPVTGTRLIDVSYSSPDPYLAAAIVNKLIGQLGEFTFQQQFTSTQQSSSWLAGQLDDLRKQMEQLQAKAIRLQRDTGMFGNDGSHNVVLDRLQSLNQSLTQAESNRILKESVDRIASTGDPELISSLSGNSSAGQSASLNTSLTLIQNLRAQQASLRSQLQEDSVRYGASYPKVAETQAQLTAIDRSITDEIHRLGERAHTDYLIAAREEAGIRSAFDEQKQAASKLNDSAVAYGLAKQEADSSRDIYETLLAKLKQEGVLEGIKASNISVVGLAQVPPPNVPSSPRIPLVLAAGIIAGLFLGSAIIVVLELTDNKLHSFEMIERTAAIPLISVLPVFKSTPRRGPARWLLHPGGQQPSQLETPRPPLSQLPALQRQPSTFAEGLRSLRTSLLLARSGQPPQVVLITSCLEAEGKTTLALNLAALLAQGGARVLLVDADLRKPTLSSYLGCESTWSGLGTALASSEAPATRQPLETMPNFSVVCGEEVPPFPSELLGSPRFKELLANWRASYDFIVLDSPPVLAVTDAVILSQVSDATLLVARHGSTTRQALRRSAEVLRRQHPHHSALGAVLNGIPRDSGDFYEYFGYDSKLYSGGPAHA